MNEAAVDIDPDTVDWEYDKADASDMRDIRGYLYKRRKRGWKLFWIEGRVLHFRRRVTVQVTQAA